MRLICKQTGNTIICMPGDQVDLSTVCARCKVEALAHGIRHAAATPERRVAARRPAEFRALGLPRQRTAKKPACSCGGHDRATEDGRTARERREDAELARELRTLRGSTTNTNTQEDSTMTTTHRPAYGYTRALAAARGEDPEEAAAAEFRQNSDKLARQRTLAKLNAEERRLAARRHAPPRPYTAALERKGAAA